MHLDDNKALAEYINYGKGSVCDISVYKTNASIRLPNCPKIDKNGRIERRCHVMKTPNSVFTDYLISDTSNLPVI